MTKKAVSENNFKQTEIGEIPADWDVKPLHSVCVETTTINPAKNPNTVIEYVDVSSVSREGCRIIGATKYAGKDAPGRARNLVKHRDVIFATVRPTLRRVALVPKELDGQVVSTAFCVIRALETQAHPEYLYYVVSSPDFVTRVGRLERGASYPAVTDANILNQKIALPTRPEQERIAGVLSKIQQAVTNQERIVADLRELKVATIAKLFREGLRGEPLKQTEIGEIPQSWDIIPASKFCVHITDGTHDTPKPSSEGHFLITSKNLRDGIVDFSGAYKISVADYLEINKRSAVDKYDVIFGMIGTVGAPVIVSENAPKFAIKNVGLFKTGDKNKSIWLINYFESPVAQRLIKAQLTGATQKYVPLWFLREFPLIVPTDIAILNEISDVLEQMNRRISLGEQKLTQYRALFSSTRNQLMTGKVRVS